MSPAVATSEAPVIGAGARPALPRQRGERLIKPDRPTLDERVSALWERLVEEGTADCPVCGDDLVAGRECGSCGSALA